MDYFKESLKQHRKKRGKLEIKPKLPLKNKRDLSIAYTPGVAQPCREIFKDVKNIYKYTIKGNSVAVVTNGTAVLGLGDIGPQAALPVMEGKCLLFKKFANIDAYPICLDLKKSNEIVKAVKAIAPGFGGINLEDIAAPECFKIEKQLIAELDIPVFHDDQHGGAIVVLAALINALKIVNKNIKQVKIIVNGAGAAGIAITKIFLSCGARDIVVLDSKGTIYKGRPNLNFAKKEIAKMTNHKRAKGKLKDVIFGKDVFIGVSCAGVLKKEWARTMNKNAIIFALANPVPEIMPDLAKQAGAKVVATGRSDFPNQINNALVFPGIFKGAIDNGVLKITNKIKIAAAKKLASLVKNPRPQKVIPNIFEKNLTKKIASMVK